MEVWLSVGGARPDTEIESLEDWLRNESVFRGRIRVVRAAASDEHLGATFDALAVAVGSGGAVTVLASSLRVWLSQPRRSDVSIRVHRKDGQVIEVNATRVADVESILAAALRDGGGQ